MNARATSGSRGREGKRRARLKEVGFTAAPTPRRTLLKRNFGFGLSARAHRGCSARRTIADLAGADAIAATHVAGSDRLGSASGPADGPSR
jgi:hypothetical protein